MRTTFPRSSALERAGFWLVVKEKSGAKFRGGYKTERLRFWTPRQAGAQQCCATRKGKEET
jgi:hypothetical protein